MRVLGLDASTRCVGVAVIEDGELIHTDHIDLNKSSSLSEKLELVENYWVETLEPMSIEAVYIEEPLIHFRAGMSSAQVIVKLALWNGHLQGMILSKTNLEPQMVNVNTARKLALPHLKFPKGSNRKQLVLEEVSRAFGMDVDMKRTGKPKDYAFDIADAVVVALAGSKQISG